MQRTVRASPVTVNMSRPSPESSAATVTIRVARQEALTLPLGIQGGHLAGEAHHRRD